MKKIILTLIYILCALPAFAIGDNIQKCIEEVERAKAEGYRVTINIESANILNPNNKIEKNVVLRLFPHFSEKCILDKYGRATAALDPMATIATSSGLEVAAVLRAPPYLFFIFEKDDILFQGDIALHESAIAAIMYSEIGFETFQSIDSTYPFVRISYGHSSMYYYIGRDLKVNDLFGVGSIDDKLYQIFIRGFKMDIP